MGSFSYKGFEKKKVSKSIKNLFFSLGGTSLRQNYKTMLYWKIVHRSIVNISKKSETSKN